MVQQREIWSRYSSAISLPPPRPPHPVLYFLLFHFLPFSLPLSRLFSCPLLHFYIHIYISLLLYFLISGRGDERRRRFLVEAKQRNKRGTNSVSSPFRAQKRVSKLLPDDSTKRRFLLCRKLPKGGALEFGCLHFFFFNLTSSSSPILLAHHLPAPNIQNKNFNIRVSRVFPSRRVRRDTTDTATWIPDGAKAS